MEQKQLVDSAALAIEIVEKRFAAYDKKDQRRPKSTMWASSIPQCRRQGYYDFVEWDKKEPFSVHLLQRFKKGEDEEKALLKELVEMGYQVVEQQTYLSKDMLENYNLSGKIDAKIVYKGRRIPLEVKSMNPYSFDKVKSIADMKEDPFMSRWYRQMQVYLLGHNEPDGLFALTDCLGHWKMIPVKLDYDAAEKILLIVMDVNKAVKEKKIPERINYDPVVCGYCSFKHICLPDVLNERKVIFENSKELEAMLERRQELEAASKEFEKLDKALKEQFKGIELASIGKFIISGKKYTRTNYNIPKDVKEKYAEKAEYWRTTITGEKNGTER